MPGEQFDAELCVNSCTDVDKNATGNKKNNSFTRCLFPVLFDDSVLTVPVTHMAELEQAHY
jgi:hypothetical protein